MINDCRRDLNLYCVRSCLVFIISEASMFYKRVSRLLCKALVAYWALNLELISLFGVSSSNLELDD